MDAVLRNALEPVLRDLARAGLEAPQFEDDDWAGDPDRAAAMMWWPDGSGAGVAVSRDAPEPARIAEAADSVQEAVIEGQLWGRAPTNWPPCPQHPCTHPLAATLTAGEAVWVCPADSRLVAPIGSL